MAYKLSFKFRRNRYPGTVADTSSKVEADMKKLLNEKRINCLRFYSVSRDNTQAGFEPMMSLALNAARTVFVQSLTKRY